jgi:hypothetical protein
MDELAGGRTIRARAMGRGMTVRCRNSQPPTRVNIEGWIVAGGWRPGTGGRELRLEVDSSLYNL